MRRLPMRALCFSCLAALICGCSGSSTARPPPLDRFYFPTGMAFAPDAGSQGVLYVASSDTDKRYDFGTLLAVDLAKVGPTPPGNQTLPAFGAPVPQSGPVQITSLNVPASQAVEISPFVGEVGTFTLPDGTLRMFVPSRAEGDHLQVIDAKGTTLSCAGGDGAAPQNCASKALSLTGHAINTDPVGQPAAQQPYGVGISSDATVYVTSLQSADSPIGSGQNISNFLFSTSATSPKVQDSGFTALGPGAGSSVAVGTRYAFVSGRFLAVDDTIPDVLLRLVDRRLGTVTFPQLERDFHVIETRGVALTRDETRLFLVGRAPDTLLVIDVQGALTSVPKLTVVHSIPLPASPDEIKLIERPGRAPIAVITCTGADSVAIYDDEAGTLAAEVPGVGTQPFGIAVDPIGAGVRLFVSDFGDGRVAVLDMPDLNRPNDVKVVAHLGMLQTCLVRSDDPSCQGSAPP